MYKRKNLKVISYNKGLHEVAYSTPSVGRTLKTFSSRKAASNFRLRISR